eukprot:s952_g11.t1
MVDADKKLVVRRTVAGPAKNLDCAVAVSFPFELLDIFVGAWAATFLPDVMEFRLLPDVEDDAKHYPDSLAAEKARRGSFVAPDRCKHPKVVLCQQVQLYRKGPLVFHPNVCELLARMETDLVLRGLTSDRIAAFKARIRVAEAPMSAEAAEVQEAESLKGIVDEQVDLRSRVEQLEQEKAELQERLDFVEELLGPTESQRRSLQEKALAARSAALQGALLCRLHVSAMACFEGCFGWTRHGGPGVPEVPNAGQPLPQLLTSAPEAPRPRNERKISKGSNTSNGSRVHYSLTGMQLPDSPIRAKKKVTYSITGMPLYEPDEPNIANDQKVAGRRGRQQGQQRPKDAILHHWHALARVAPAQDPRHHGNAAAPHRHVGAAQELERHVFLRKVSHLMRTCTLVDRRFEGLGRLGYGTDICFGIDQIFCNPFSGYSLDDQDFLVQIPTRTGALIEAKTPPLEVDGAGSFLALGHAAGYSNNALYSVAKPGAAAFRIDPAGLLTHLNTVKCDISGAAHVSTAYVGMEGVVITSAYGGGGLNVIKVREDGCLAEVEPGASIQHHGGSNVYQPAEGNEQEQAHPHSCFLDPEGRLEPASQTYAVDASKGRLEARGALATAPGAGPRHLCFHPSGQLVYGINELDCTINVYSYDRDEGKLGLIQTVSTLPAGYNNRDHANAKNAAGEPATGPNRPQQTNATADIHVSPDGRFVYGSNRGHDSLVCFAATGSQLDLVGFTYTEGAHPRNFSIHPSGDWVLARSSHRWSYSDGCPSDSQSSQVHCLGPSRGASQQVRPSRVDRSRWRQNMLAKWRGACIPTKVAGRLDERLVAAQGLAARDAGLLQGGCLPDAEGILQDVSLLGDPAFRPFSPKTGRVKWAARGGLLRLSLEEVQGRFGEEVAQDVLRCARELDEYDASRRVGLELPWHPVEDSVIAG